MRDGRVCCAVGGQRVGRWLLLGAFLLGAGWAPATPPVDEPLLARVEVDRPLDRLGLPVFAAWEDAAGCRVALVRATRQQLDAAGVAYLVLDEPFFPGGYLVTAGAWGQVRHRLAPSSLVWDDGPFLVLRGETEVARALQGDGVRAWRLPEEPLVLEVPATPPLAAPLAYDPLVAAMVAQISQDAVLAHCRQLSGAEPALVGGVPYTITTRHTASGTPIEKATQFAAEHLGRQGLAASFQAWSAGGYSGRNVAAVLPGGARASEIVLVTAHLDDMPAPPSTAPGADDNASGSVAVMVAAEVMPGYTFERTVHFVFFTGEEQWLLGADAYAQALADAGANVVAVLNLDMIAYENVGAPVANLHTRRTWHPGYPADLEIAQAFIDAVSLYGLAGALQPTVIPDSIPYSDHAEFWDRGFPAILAIEDDKDDFNPNYHSTADTVSTLDPAYFTAFVKAAVATAAHLALPTGVVCQPPEAPLLQAPATAASGEAYLVSWSATSDEGTYELEEDTQEDFATPAAMVLPTTAVTVTRASAGNLTVYTRVRALETCGDTPLASPWSATAVTEVTGGGTCAVEVTDRTVTGAEMMTSCGTLAVGPAVAVAGGGSATFRAATAVVLRNGVTVAAGASLAAGADPALAAR